MLANVKFLAVRMKSDWHFLIQQSSFLLHSFPAAFCSKEKRKEEEENGKEMKEEKEEEQENRDGLTNQIMH
jgi:hypothetical protein